MSTSTARRRPTTQEIRHALSQASFAALSHVTPAGAPRSSGVVYTMSGDRMYVVVAEDSWKARHIAAHGIVAVTVPSTPQDRLPCTATVHRGGFIG
jgi:hypothetical protein